MWRADFRTNLGVDMFETVLDPQLLAIILIGITTYFNDTKPDYSEILRQNELKPTARSELYTHSVTFLPYHRLYGP
jgi:hypothetical protein